jgi:membrane protein YqaA with SNARE-associated domain
MRFLRPLFASFFSPLGLGALAALDSSLIFFLPFGVDAVLITLVARHPDRLWLCVLTATAGSVAGATLTFFLGRRLGDDGIKRFVDQRRLSAFRNRFSHRVALSTAVAAVIPPPFPFTAVLLTCGAIKAPTFEVLTGLAVARLVRFAAEAWLARHFGTHVLRVMETSSFRWAIGAFIALAVAGTAWSAWKVMRTGRPAGVRPARA